MIQRGSWLTQTVGSMNKPYISLPIYSQNQSITWSHHTHSDSFIILASRWCICLSICVLWKTHYWCYFRFVSLWFNRKSLLLILVPFPRYLYILLTAFYNILPTSQAVVIRLFASWQWSFCLRLYCPYMQDSQIELHHDLECGQKFWYVLDFPALYSIQEPKIM